MLKNNINYSKRLVLLFISGQLHRLTTVTQRVIPHDLNDAPQGLKTPSFHSSKHSQPVVFCSAFSYGAFQRVKTTWYLSSDT